LGALEPPAHAGRDGLLRTPGGDFSGVDYPRALPRIDRYSDALN
jgi:hypothetical protein